MSIEKTPSNNAVQQPLLPRSLERYIGSPAEGIDVFQIDRRIELQSTMAKTSLTLAQSRELRRYLEQAEQIALGSSE